MQVTKATITPLEDGTFAVECEHTKPDMQDDMPPGMPPEMSQPEIYDTLDEAMEYLRSKLTGKKSKEKMMMEGEEDFLAGFKGANGDQGY
jgi:hypothetical protein